MEEDNHQLNEYLKRINYDTSNKILAVSFETLRDLHKAHSMNIVFENTSIFMNEPISTVSSDIYDKIVRRKRGGYCFEMNQLFADMMKRLQFQVKQLAARVLVGAPSRHEYINPVNHQIAIVTVDDKEYLCDVGFGGYCSLYEPIPFEIDVEFKQLTNSYKIVKDDILGYVLQWKHVGMEQWKDCYGFHLVEYFPTDYAMMNYFTCTNPKSMFKQILFVSIPTEEGVICLFNNKLAIREGDQISTTDVTTMTECREILKKYYHLDLPENITIPGYT
jgi:N-hydroxyarylamine O-acetyltransferase